MTNDRRWAVMSRKVIGAQDNPMLIRWRLLQTPWFGIYVHLIHREDLDREPHDHPWTFRTWIVRGAYIEQYWPDARLVGDDRGRPVQQIRPRWSYRRFPLAAAHRITAVDGKLTTLVLVGRKRRTWGFYNTTSGIFTDWRDYRPNRNGWSEQQQAEGAPS